MRVPFFFLAILATMIFGRVVAVGAVHSRPPDFCGCSKAKGLNPKPFVKAPLYVRSSPLVMSLAPVIQILLPFRPATHPKFPNHLVTTNFGNLSSVAVAIPFLLISDS